MAVITIRLSDNDIKLAIADWVRKQFGKETGDIHLSGSAAHDIMDRPTGGVDVYATVTLKEG